MKKYSLIVFIILAALSVLAIPTINNTAQQTERTLPAQVSVAYPAISLMFSYNDYFMGGYYSLPIRMQNNGNIYIVYHAQPADQSYLRQVYYSYIQNGQNTYTGRITAGTQREGYPSIVLDPVTNDPLVAWHADSTGTNRLDCFFSYDPWHLFDTYNHWATNSLIIDNLPNADQFLWPNVFVSDSPLGNEYRRAYIYANNEGITNVNMPSENVVLLYADYTTEMLDGTSPLIWTSRTIPQLDDWHNSPTYHRPFTSFFCKGSLVGFMGTLSTDSLHISEPDLFVLYNNNYGMGDFTLDRINSEFYVTDSLGNNQDSLYFAPLHSKNRNVFLDSENRLHMINSYNLMKHGSYYPHFSFVKDVQYDFNNHQFKVLDIEPKGKNDANYFNYEDDGQIFVPWDTDNNGIADSTVVTDFPCYWWDYYDTSNENNFRITSVPNENILVAVWQNSYKSQQFNEYGNLNYAVWEDVPEVVVEISLDNGKHWSRPFYLNSIEQPEIFGGMIPEYIYPCDDVEKYTDNNGDTQARVHFLFFDDLEYGRSVQGPEWVGGTVKYMALDFNLTQLVENNNIVGINEITSNPCSILKQNYPNPFNPSTTISYNLSKTQTVNLNIYNTKGQLVRNLVNETQSAGNYHQLWDGKNNKSQAATSGIYFYRISAGNKTETKKMLLIK